MIRIITSLVAVLTVASVYSQANIKETPRLVVGITIDQLRGDYLELFQHTFSEKGFKRLLNEGLVYQNISYDFPEINAAAAIATVYTGANPFYHGITSHKKYSARRNSILPIFSDDEFLGNYTQEKLSPRALRVSTVTDELKIASQGFSDVYAFAANPEMALVSAGYAGNGAYWLDNYTGKWATSTYYGNFHWTVDTENRNGTYSNSIGSLAWRPLYALEQYNAFPYTTNRIAFQHLFESPELLKKSPLTNENICNTALQLVEKAEMGKRSYPDFLSLVFYVGNYPKAADKNYSLELQDSYARLDQEISRLLDKIDKTVGLKNTLIFVTSTGYYEAEDIYPANLKLSGGVFYVNRCEALLNMYLMALYGQEEWVERIYNGQVYLNRKLIENKNIDLGEFQAKAAEFVSQFTGVQDVATSVQLLTGNASDNMKQYKNIFNKDVSGDIFIEIQPGFKVVNEQENNFEEKRIRNTAVAAPVIFFGNGIKPQKVKRTVKATEIAPTISHILRIRAPDAARSQALPEFL